MCTEIGSSIKTARSEYFCYMELHAECTIRVVQLEGSTSKYSGSTGSTVGAGDGSVRASYLTIAQGVVH